MRVRRSIPSLRLHRPTGKAVVTLSGRDFYCGPWGSRSARDEYDRLIGEWLASGRTIPSKDENGLLVLDLVDRFLSAEPPSASQAYDYKSTLRLLLRLYGRTPAIDFSPLALRAIRERWVDAGLRRNTINSKVHKIRRVFRWAVSHQLIPPAVLQVLESVDNLAAGKTVAPESVKVQAVETHRVDLLLKTMPPMLAAMVRIQLLTGMRAKEMCMLRACDIDTANEVWVYRPSSHKTSHKGKLREVAFGPQAIDLLRPWLLPGLQDFIFSPARAESDRIARTHAIRKTPLSCGNRPGRRSPAGRPAGERPRKFASHYTTGVYATAIGRLINKAFPPPEHLACRRGETEQRWRDRLGPEKWLQVLAWRRKHRWTPHQLRHTFGERVREQFGLDHAQVALGHSHARTTEIYAKVSRAKATQVAALIG